MKPRKTIRWSQATRDAKRFIENMRELRAREEAARRAQDREGPGPSQELQHQAR